LLGLWHLEEHVIFLLCGLLFLRGNLDVAHFELDVVDLNTDKTKLETRQF
jgi:hypothetical protein